MFVKLDKGADLWYNKSRKFPALCVYGCIYNPTTFYLGPHLVRMVSRPPDLSDVGSPNRADGTHLLYRRLLYALTAGREPKKDRISGLFLSNK